MAHIEKYKRHAVGHMLAHYRRDPSSLGRGNIDPTRSGLNKTIGFRPGSGLIVETDEKPNWDVVRERIGAVDRAAAAQGKRRTRKDAVVLADMVITLPTNVPASDMPRFFCATYEYMAATFGRENMLGGFVHLDEVRTRREGGKDVPTGEPVRPHMHVPFTPIKDGSFNYKAMCPRSFYKRFHGELGDFLEARLGYRPEVTLEGATRAQKAMSAMSHAEMDAVRDEILMPAHAEAGRVYQQAFEEARAVRVESRAEVAEKRSQAAALSREIEEKTAARDALRADVAVFSEKRDELRGELERTRMELDQTKAEVEALRGENEALKGQVATGRHERDRLKRELSRMGDERRAMANEIELLRRRMAMFVAAAKAFVGAVRARGLGRALADVLALSDKNPLVQDMFERADNNPDADFRLYDDVLEQSGYEVLDEEQADIGEDLGRMTRTYGLDDGDPR